MTAHAIKIRGKNITQDANGLVCLNDIHRAAGFRTKNQSPSDWMRLRTTHSRIERVLKLNTGKSRNWLKDDFKSTYYTKRGAGGGTFVDPRLALDYAEYLNPKLAIEVKEVFLRYKSADPTLADEVLDRATPEENEWAARRAIGRAVRGAYTSELKARGVVSPKHYAICTNTTYQGVFGAPAKKLKEQKGLKPKANLRDNMSMSELAYLAASEALSVERMDDEECQGFNECNTATDRAANAIRSAIEADRKDRQKRL